MCAVAFDGAQERVGDSDRQVEKESSLCLYILMVTK